MARLEKHTVERKSGMAKRFFVIVGILLGVLAVASASYYWFGGGLTEKSKEDAIAEFYDIVESTYPELTVNR